MTKDTEVVRGTGNVFRDFGRPNADLEQLRSMLAARIIRVLDERALSVRKAKEITGVAAADFSRIRRANLGRFTIDRFMTILARLDQQVQVRVTVRPRPHEGGRAMKRVIHARSVGAFATAQRAITPTRPEASPITPTAGAGRGGRGASRPRS